MIVLDTPSISWDIAQSSDHDATAFTNRHQQFRQEWDRQIDKHLIEWGRHPQDFSDDEINPPSLFAIQAACSLAVEMRDAKLAPPHRMLLTVDGGVAFERYGSRSTLASMEIASDGTVSLMIFEQGQLVAQQRVIRG